ncbi:MAG TPA: aminotransferase class V-fold PLP-dependent enzyme [Nevskiaceae bacterium]|nr:aminotransferase class V-fold PLP-dependent enzyme [Nevskiaceae bacterium]
MSLLPRSLKPAFSRFLGARPGRLHAAAHSHHPWPDVSFDAQQQCWLDAARLMDEKWTAIFAEQIPRAQGHLARLLQLPDPRSLVFAPNTHEFLLRLLSCLPPRPRILTTDSEFHSLSRQLRRLEEDGAVQVARVAVEPFDTFPARWVAAIRQQPAELIWFSQCFFNSGYRLTDLQTPVAAVPDPQTLVVIDGYHGFMAMPTDLSALADRVFYLGGGYKYAMSGEGICFLHAPPGQALRPVNTGWYAGFGQLVEAQAGRVAYAEHGGRLWGATFDPSGLYRFNAVMDWLLAEGLSPASIHAHVQQLQSELLARLEPLWLKGAHSTWLSPAAGQPRGNFLSFRHPQALTLQQRLSQLNVVSDVREDRLRIGLGLYHDLADIDELVGRLQAARL